MDALLDDFLYDRHFFNLGEACRHQDNHEVLQVSIFDGHYLLSEEKGLNLFNQGLLVQPRLRLLLLLVEAMVLLQGFDKLELFAYLSKVCLGQLSWLLGLLVIGA